MMLAANVSVAKFFTSREIPALYRIHEPPNEQAISLLERYMTNFGGKTQLNTGKLQKRLTKALEEFNGRPEAQILHILTLRSMSQAKYSQNNLGHFGLGFDFYTHFTSPIRRYPDLIVHRLLKNQVMPNSKYRLMNEEDLATAGTILSAAEQRSTKAERQVQSIKKARFMEKFVGQEFDGMISSVAKFGVFVLLRQYDIDGLIRLDDLGGDRFEYDEENLRLVARKSGFAYSIGDAIRIQVAAADPELGQINFVVTQEGRQSIEKAARSNDKPIQKLQERRPEQSKDRDRERGRGRHDKKPHRKDRDERHKDRDAVSAKKGDNKGPARKDSRGPAPKSAQRPSPAGGKNQKSRFFRDSREDDKGKADKMQKVLKPSGSDSPQVKKSISQNLLDMILGPEEYRRATGETSSKDKPKLSKKLMFAENSKLQDNDKYSENNSDSLKDEYPDRKDPKKRGTPQDDRGSVRKTRVPPGRGKGKAR